MLIRQFLANFPMVRSIRSRVYRERFFRADGGGMFCGRFESVEEARSPLASGLASTYANPSLIHLNEELFREVHSFDWPVLFHLQKFVRELSADSLIDFGGHLGVKFTAFRDHLDLPEGFRWQVVETPPMVAAGREIARSRGLPDLSFVESFVDADPAKILLCSGVLQYTVGTLDEMLESSGLRPDVVIINKLPISKDGGFFTLENFGAVKLPYRIFDAHAHQRMCERLGYRRSCCWPIPHRDFRIPFVRSPEMVRMVGEVWVRS